MLNDTAKSIRLLKSINYDDSALFGLNLDIFKISLFMSVVQTRGLPEFGFDQSGVFADNLVFDFRLVSFVNLRVNKGEFGPAYLPDGELAAINFGPSVRSFSIKQSGASGMTDRIDNYRDMVPIYEVTLDFACGSIEFSFSNLRVRQFIPERIDD